jgi:cephalosporin hydroxylase
MSLNPYKNRTLPVGALEFPRDTYGKAAVEKYGKYAQLEYGEPELLYYMPVIVGGGYILNLGHSYGGSAYLMAQSLIDNELSGKVSSVDCFGGRRRRFNQREKSIHELGLEDKLSLHFQTTEEFISNVAGLSYIPYASFVFIDADHSYKGVLNDFCNYGPFVKAGGMIAFHDTNQDYTDKVIREEVLGDPTWTEVSDLHVNRIRVFKKKGV